MLQHKLLSSPLLNGKTPKPQKDPQHQQRLLQEKREPCCLGRGDGKTETRTENTFIKMNNNGIVRITVKQRLETDKVR